MIIFRISQKHYITGKFWGKKGYKSEGKNLKDTKYLQKIDNKYFKYFQKGNEQVFSNRQKRDKLHAGIRESKKAG